MCSVTSHNIPVTSAIRVYSSYMCSITSHDIPVTSVIYSLSSIESCRLSAVKEVRCFAMEDFDLSSWLGNMKLIFLKRLLFPKDTLPLYSLRREVGLDCRISSSPTMKSQVTLCKL